MDGGFLHLLLQEGKPLAPLPKPSPWALMAAGLKDQKLATGDIIDRLRELQPKERNECEQS